MDNQIPTLKGKISDISSRMAASPTAYAGSTAPSQSDLRLDTQRRALEESLQKARDENLKERWFQDSKTTSEGGQTGLIGRALHGLTVPLYGIVGAAEYAAGKNPRAGFWENVEENVTTGKRTFSDLLKRSGMPGVGAGPLGFAMDIAADPVNWITLGTAALIPRMGAGLVKAGPAGLAKAVESKALKGAAGLMKVTGAGGTDMYKKVAQRSFDSSVAYNSLIGADMRKILTESKWRDGIQGLKRQVVASNPNLEKIYGAFEYNPQRWHDQVRLQDALLKGVKDEDLFNEARKRITSGEDPAEVLADIRAKKEKQIGEAASNVGQQVSPIPDPTDNVSKEQIEEAKAYVKALGGRTATMVSEKLKEAADAADIMQNPLKNVVDDGAENAARIIEERMIPDFNVNDFKELQASGLMDETGIKWYDDAKEKIKAWNKKINLAGKEIEISGKKILDGYDLYMSMFRRFKVPGSPSAYTNAIVGNPFMAKMAGLDAFSGLFAKRVSQAASALGSGKNSDIALLELLKDGKLREYLMEHPKEWSGMVGVSPSAMGYKLGVDRAVRLGREMNIVPANMTDDDIAKAIAGEIEAVLNEIPLSEVERAAMAKAVADGKTVAEAFGEVSKRSLMQSPNEIARSMALSKGGKMSSADLPIGMAPQEFFNSTMANEFLDKISKRAAKEGNHGAKVLDFFLNKTANYYERIDQSFRFGTISYMTNDGLSEKELRVLKRFVKLSPEDLATAPKNVGGEPRWTLSPEKAMEAASMIYLNYAAMPAAIKVLRNLPLLGSPFASFMYGMTLKTLQTAVYNPAVFNKITLALHDLGGTKGPLERQNLESPYYSRLKDQAMYRLPFFQEYPLYLNMANMLPYYSLNMFQPVERNYGKTIPDALVYALDKLPVGDDPAFQVMFDYLILPMILDEATATGTFGQPIYPKGASAGEKAFYAARAFADTITPGSLGALGLVTPDVDIPFTDTSAIELAPSYRWRQVAQAKGGKNVFGVSGKESAVSRTLRSLGATAGVPIQSPMDLTYLQSEFKKDIKE